MQPPFAAADDRRTPRVTARHPGRRSRRSRRARARASGEEALRRSAEDVLGQQPRLGVAFRIEPASEALAGGEDLLVHAHETAVASLSFSDW